MTIAGANIELVKQSNIPGAIFSILIPSWNNLPYLQLCIESIRKNSSFRHQLIVHINEGRDGTVEWIRSQPDIDYSYSTENIGVCYALNSCRPLVATDYILYLNDDMYVCPGWDKFLLDEIKAIGHSRFFLSSTAIEPKAQSNCSIEYDFGRNIETFHEQELLAGFASLPMKDWQGATWPPNIVHRDVWDLAGGYSTEFSPGMYSDPDFSMKLWQMGIRIFKGVAASRVYHFGSISVKRVTKNKGYYMFINKWGITSSTLSKYYLKRGRLFTGALPEPGIPSGLAIKNVFKQVIAIFHRS